VGWESTPHSLPLRPPHTHDFLGRGRRGVRNEKNRKITSIKLGERDVVVVVNVGQCVVMVATLSPIELGSFVGKVC